MCAMDFSNLFHDSSKDLTGGGSVRIPQDSREWPAEWTTVGYKAYPRFERIPLAHSEIRADLFETITHRESRRDFGGDPISLAALSGILEYSCGIVGGRGKSARAQPSGGGRYPIEAYPIVFRGSNELPAGVYHYNVKDHALEALWPRAFAREEILDLFTYEWAADASLAIILSAVFDRTQAKYGERGYRYIMIEAGHIGQNVYLASTALWLKCCALGGTRDAHLEKLIDIDGITESVVYGLVVG
jgi:SagB-type dehydrogenase family enzyme